VLQWNGVEVGPIVLALIREIYICTHIYIPTYIHIQVILSGAVTCHTHMWLHHVPRKAGPRASSYSSSWRACRFIYVYTYTNTYIYTGLYQVPQSHGGKVKPAWPIVLVLIKGVYIHILTCIHIYIHIYRLIPSAAVAWWGSRARVAHRSGVD